MTTLADVEPITQILGNVLTGEPVAHGALTMIPLLAPALADPGWLTLAEAGPKVQISEVGEAGSVPELTLTSTADAPLLLLDGEELVGAKQNRVLNTSVLVAAGDACSASRPGARRETLERYVKRMEELESIATSFPGVEQADAIQAGRELRVLVSAKDTTDDSAAKICHDIARAFEERLTYPGEIKVTVLRETRVVELAR